MTTDLDIMNIGVGSDARRLTITNVTFKTVTVAEDKTAEKIYLECVFPDSSHAITISETWCNKDGKYIILGLWISLDMNKQLLKGSALGTLLAYLGADKIGDLIGKEAIGYPDKNGYTIISNFKVEDPKKLV